MPMKDLPNFEVFMTEVSLVCLPPRFRLPATTRAGVGVASVAISSLGGVLREFEHAAASIGEIVPLLTLLDRHPLGVHGRAACGSRSRRCTHGSANHHSARDRATATVPAGIHVDVLVDVDAVAAAAADVAGTGVRATAAATGPRATTTAATGRSATPAAATASAATAATSRSVSVGGHGEAGQNEGGHCRRKQLAE